MTGIRGCGVELAPKQAQKQLGLFCFNEAGGGRCIRNLALVWLQPRWHVRSWRRADRRIGTGWAGFGGRAECFVGRRGVFWAWGLGGIGPGGLVYRCIGVLPHSCADRSQGLPGSVYRCITAIPRRSLPMPPGSVYRCIGVLPQSGPDRSQGPPGSVYRRIGVLPQSGPDRSQDPPGSMYRCIAAILRRSLTGPPWVGVSVYRCMGRGDRCIGVSVYFNFPAPSCGRTEVILQRPLQS